MRGWRGASLVCGLFADAAVVDHVLNIRDEAWPPEPARDASNHLLLAPMAGECDVGAVVAVDQFLAEGGWDVDEEGAIGGCGGVKRPGRSDHQDALPDGYWVGAEVGGRDDGIGGIASGDEGGDFVNDGPAGLILLLEPAEAGKGLVRAEGVGDVVGDEGAVGLLAEFHGVGVFGRVAVRRSWVFHAVVPGEEVRNYIGRAVDRSPDGEEAVKLSVAVGVGFGVAGAEHLVGKGPMVRVEEETSVFEIRREFVDSPDDGFKLC